MFNDQDSLDEIMSTTSSSYQKILGRTVKNFEEDKWIAVRYKVMYDANYAKFSQNPKLAKSLLDTGDKELVYASFGEMIWGIGKKITDEDLSDETTWVGDNLLGKVLMDVRTALKNDPNLVDLTN